MPTGICSGKNSWAILDFQNAEYVQKTSYTMCADPMYDINMVNTLTTPLISFVRPIIENSII